MIAVPGGIKVMVASQPVDFRKGMDGLAALVQEELQRDPFSGSIFVFRARRSDRVKIVWWDGSGLCLYTKRLEQGGFRWPPIRNGLIHLNPAQLSALIEGMDWTRVKSLEVTPPRLMR